MIKRIAAVTAATVLIFVGGSREPEAERAEIIVAADDPGTAADRETKRETGTIEKDKEAEVNDTTGTETAVDRPDEGLGSASVADAGGDHGREEPAAAEGDGAGHTDVSGGEVSENDAGQAGTGDADNGQGYSDGAEIPDEAFEEDGGASGEDSGEDEVTEPVMEHLGDWTITGYCGCSECNGVWADGRTAYGEIPTAGHTIACNVLPAYTQVMINDTVYTVEDTGSTPYGDEWVDIYFNTHEEALNWGVKVLPVYLLG